MDSPGHRTGAVAFEIGVYRMSGIFTPAFLLGGSPGGGELLVVFLAVLVLFGSKRLPGLARSLGRALEEFRRAARDVSDEIKKAAEPTTPPPPPGEAKKLPEKESDHERVG